MSRTIEENVVVLKFDQEDFQSNVEKAVGVLDKLSNAIDKSSSGNSLKSINTAIKNVDFDSMSKGIDNISSKFGVLGAVGQAAISKLTQTTMDKVGSILTSVPNKIFKGGLTRALNLQQAEYQVKALGFTWKSTMKSMEGETKDVFTAVDRAVTGTAYSLDQAAMTASQILASNPSLSLEDLEMHLKRISGVAAMTGREYSEIGYIFAQVSGQGRLMGDQLMQLSYKGLNVAADIAKYLNSNKEAFDKVISKESVSRLQKLGIQSKVTEGQIRELVSDGVIDFETFSAATEHYMSSAFGANELYTGSLANLNAALARLGEKLETNKIENLTRIFNALRPLINTISERLNPVINLINKASDAITGKFVKAINWVNKALGGVVDNGKVDKVSKIIENVSNKTKKSSDTIEKAASKLRLTQKEYDAVWDIWNYGTYGTGEKRKKSLEALGMSYKNVQDYINEFYKVGFDKSKVDYEIIDNTKKKNKELKKEGQNLKKTNTAAHTSLKTLEFLNGELTPMQKLLHGISSALIVVRNGFDSFKIVTKSFFTILKTIGQKLFGSLANKILSLGDYLVLTSFRFKDFIKEFSTKAIDKFDSTVLPGMISGLRSFIGWIQKASDSVVNFFKTNTKLKEAANGFQNIFSGLFTIIKNIFGNIKGLLNSIKTEDRFSEFREKASGLVDILKKLGTGVLDTVVDGIVALGDAIQNASKGNALTAIVQLLTKLFDGIKNLGSSVSGAKGSISTFNSLITGTGASLTALGEGINNQPASKGNNTFDKLSEFFKSITEAFNTKNIDGEKIAKIGLYIAGIIGTLKLTKSMTQQGNGVTKSLSGMIDSFAGIFKSFGSIFTSTSTTITKLGSLFDEIGNLSKAIQTRVKLESFKMIALSVGIIAGAIVAISLIPAERLMPSVIAVGTLVGLLCGTLIYLTKQSSALDGPKLQALGLSLAGVGAGILLLALACKTFAGINGDNLFKAGAAIVTFMGMMAIVSKAAGSMAKSGFAFIGMALAVDILLKTCLLIAAIPETTMIKGALGVLSLVTILALACRIAGNNAFNGVGLLGLSAAVATLIPTIIVLAFLPWPMILKGVAALDLVLLSLIMSVKSMDGINAKSLLSLGVLAGVIAEISMALMVLSIIPVKRLLSAATALSGVMLAIGESTKLAKGAMKGALGMSAVMLIVGGMVIAISKTNPKAAIKIASSLSALILSLGISMKLLSTIPDPKGILIACGALLAGIASIGLVIAALYELTKHKLISGKILDKTATITAKIGSVIGSFFGGINKGYVDSSSKKSKSLAKGLKDFTDSVVPFVKSVKDLDVKDLSKIKDITDAMHDVFDIGRETVDTSNFTTFGESLEPFLNSYKKFAKSVKNIDEDTVEKTKLVSDTIKVLAGIKFQGEGGTLQDFTGSNNIANFSKELSEAIKPLGEFYTAIQSEGGALRNPPSKEQIQAITTGFNLLIKAQNKLPKTNGTIQQITGEKNLADFASKMASMVKPLGEFYTAIQSEGGALSNPPSEEQIQAITTGLNLLIKCQNGMETDGGLKSFIFGWKDLGSFVRGLNGLAPDLGEFFTTVKGFEGNIPVERIKNISIALQAMIDLQNGMETDGGLKSFIFGWKDLGSFVRGLKRLAPNLGEFFTTVKGIKGDIPVERIKNISIALQYLVDLQKTLPKEGGLFTKKQDISQFGQDVQDLGEAVKEYVKSLKGIEISDIENANKVVEAAFKMVKTFNKNTSIGTTKNNKTVTTPQIGTSLNGKNSVISTIQSFAKNIKAIDTESMGKKSADIKKSINGLNKAIEGSIELKGAKLTGEGSLVQTIRQFVKAVSSIDLSGISKKSSAISQAISELNKAVSSGSKSIKTSDYSKIGEKLGTGLANGIKSKTKNVKSAVKSLVNSAKKSVTSLKGPFKSAASGAGSAFVKGLKGYVSAAKAQGKAIGSSAKSGLTGQNIKGRYKDAGNNAGRGLVNGINSWGGKAYNAGQYLGRQANKGLKATLKIASPSKVFTRDGEYVGEGFVNGIKNYALKVYKAGVELATNAITGTASVSSDIFDDLKDPVIRPVLDLSNVQNGVNSIDNMFARNQAMSINARMNNAKQSEVTNADVVRAINSLNSKIDGSPRTVTNINGITYDDGSNIVDAVETLVHAVKIEGRV